MAEPFDVNLDDPQGVSLAPAGTPPDVGLLPDTGTVLGPPPRLTLPPPPPPPPSPTDDPRQQLAALMALGMSIGMGPHGGGAGALQGFAQTQQALRQDQLGRYQRAVNDQKAEEAVQKTQFQQDSIDYRQREARLQSALANFKTQAMKVSSKAEYDGLAEAYGNSLQAAGYRTITPNWLRQQIPYVKPSQTGLAEKAFKAWQSNPNNKRLLDDDPATAMSSQIEVDLNGDGIKERMPLAKLAEAAGQSFAHDADGKLIAVPVTTKAGTSEFQTVLQGLVDEFTATNRRPPNPKEKNDLIAQAQKKASAGDDSSISLSPAGLDAAALNYAKTGQLPPMGMGKSGAAVRSQIINRAAALNPDLDIASNKATFTADADSLKKLQSLRDAVSAFERTAGANLDRFMQSAKEIVDSGSPLVNRPYRQVRRLLLGDPKMAAFDAARLAAQNEVARVLNTANLNGQLSDNARSEMESALSPDATIQQLAAAVNILRADMRSRQASYDAQLAEIRGRVRQPTTTPPPTASGKTIGRFQVTVSP